MTEHEHYMAEAITLAREAAQQGEVPVGAVLVVDGKVLARGHNRRQTANDPTAHAEVEALRAAGATLGSWHLEGTLYVTQEPCPMCAGAIVNARVERLVYGCSNPKAGAVDTLFQIPTDVRLNHRVEVVRGVLESECGALLTAFFRALRAEQNSHRGADKIS